MDLGLSGRVAVVAGASSGIGLAIAEAFAAEGTLLALCARDEKKLEAAANRMREQYGVQIESRAVDVSKPAQVQGFVFDMAAVFQRLDICVSNAGGPPAKDFLATTADDWQSAFETNLHSSVTLAQAVLPHMQRAKWGRVLVVTSVAVRQSLAQLVLSNTVRTGVLGLLRSISNEFASYGITANNVAPGYTATGRLMEMKSASARASGRSEQEIEADWIANIPAGRLAEPHEIADAVVWLASERAAYITGQTLVVDGGFWKGL